MEEEIVSSEEMNRLTTAYCELVRNNYNALQQGIKNQKSKITGSCIEKMWCKQYAILSQEKENLQY